MTKWQRTLVAYLIVAILAVGLTELFPPTPATVAGWMKALAPYVFVVIWVEYRAWQRAKDKLAEAQR